MSRIPPPPRMCVRRHTHRDERPGSHARRYRDDEVAGCVQEVSARRLSTREADSSRRKRASRNRSVGSHGRVLAPISIAAPFIGNSALCDGVSPSLLSMHLPCYNWRPKHVGIRTPSTTSVQENPIRIGRIGSGNCDSALMKKYTLLFFSFLFPFM